MSQNWADAMNQMTTNLRRSALTAMEKNDTVGKLEDEQASANSAGLVSTSKHESIRGGSATDNPYPPQPITATTKSDAATFFIG
jgi:hypothetical protein